MENSIKSLFSYFEKSRQITIQRFCSRVVHILPVDGAACLWKYISIDFDLKTIWKVCVKWKNILLFSFLWNFNANSPKNSLKDSFCNEEISIYSMVFIHDIKDYLQENMLRTLNTWLSWLSLLQTYESLIVY